MNSQFKYFSSASIPEHWGIRVVHAGLHHAQIGNNYSSIAHADKYPVNANKGEVLQEYQMIYLTRGEGIFESPISGKTKVAAGTLMIVFPGEKHRYKPFRGTGSDGYWVVFRGKIMDDLVESEIFSPEKPCLTLGLNLQIRGLFREIVEQVNANHTIKNIQLSGAMLHLIGCIENLNHPSAIYSISEQQLLVERAKVIFSKSIMEPVSLKQVASELGLGYSNFRMLFKNVTGVAPGQYFLSLRIEKAKGLLLDTKSPIKGIAYLLHFESHFYFSKVFKKKTGYSPGAYRALSGNAEGM